MYRLLVSFGLSVLLAGCSGSAAIRELSEDQVIVWATHASPAQVRQEAGRGCASHGRTAVPVSKQCVDALCRTQAFLFACRRSTEVSRSHSSPWLGFSVDDIADHRYADPPGSSEIVVSRVFADGPAKRAGLRVGDIIESFNGVIISDSIRLVDLKNALGRGEPILIEIRRGNTKLRLSMAAEH